MDDFLGMGEKDLQEEMVIKFSSVDLFLEWNEIIEKFGFLNEAGKAKAFDYLDVLISHPQYSIKKD